MVFCQAGFGQLFCTKTKYLCIRKAFGENQCLPEWTKLSRSQPEFIHGASECFRNKLTSPETWPHADAAALAARSIIQEPWQGMNANTQDSLSHRVTLPPEELLNESWAVVEVRTFTLAAIIVYTDPSCSTKPAELLNSSECRVGPADRAAEQALELRFTPTNVWISPQSPAIKGWEGSSAITCAVSL